MVRRLLRSLFFWECEGVGHQPYGTGHQKRAKLSPKLSQLSVFPCAVFDITFLLPANRLL